jgi:hypothetical protein
MKVCGVPDSTFYSARKQLLLGEYVARLGKRYILLAKALDVLGPQVSGLTPTPKALQKDSNESGSHLYSKAPTLPLRELELWRSGTGTLGTADADGADEEDAVLLQREQLALVTLDEAFGARGATDAEWRDACIERGQGRTSYYRAKPVLLARGLVVVEGTGAGARYWLAHERAAVVEPEPSHRQVPGTSGTTGTGASGTGGTSGASGTSDTVPDAGAADLEGGLPWQ